MEKAKKIEEIEKYSRRVKGKSQLLKYLSGERLTPRQAIIAKCYECCGYCVDGIEICTIENCPLYPYSPFRRKMC